MSASPSPRFVTDDEGNRVAVIVDLAFYDELLEAFEELEDIRAYDEAKEEGGEVIPFDQAMQEIERTRS